MRDPVTHDELDDLVLDHSRSSATEHRALAERFLGWAEDPHPYDEPSPRELFTQAGEQLEFAGDDEGALAAYRRAVASHGSVALDPRCLVVDLLHRRGEHEEADGVEQELRRSRPAETGTYEYMGSLCEELGETTRALGWYARGLSLAERDGLPEAQMGQLCLQRWRLRQRLGQDPDQFDEFAMDFQERVQRDLTRQQ